MTATACPAREVLLAFHTGELPEAAVEGIIDHLSQCSACQATVDTFGEAEDSLVARPASAGRAGVVHRRARNSVNWSNARRRWSRQAIPKRLRPGIRAESSWPLMPAGSWPSSAAGLGGQTRRAVSQLRGDALELGRGGRHFGFFFFRQAGRALGLRPATRGSCHQPSCSAAHPRPRRWCPRSSASIGFWKSWAKGGWAPSTRHCTPSSTSWWP